MANGPPTTQAEHRRGAHPVPILIHGILLDKSGAPAVLVKHRVVPFPDDK